MQCMSCDKEINPTWTHAIDMNSCPFCGNAIMDEDLKDLLGVLRNTLEDLSKYPDHLNDWLLSNYQFIKTDSPNLVNHLSHEDFLEWKKSNLEKEFETKKYGKRKIKVDTDEGEEEVEVQSLQSDDKTSEFFKRSGALKRNEEFTSVAEKQAHLKALMKKAQLGPQVITKEELESDVEPLNEYELQQLSNMNGSNSSSSEEDEIPASVLALGKKFGNSNKVNEIDLIRQQQARQERARKAFHSEGSIGFGNTSKM